MRTVTMQGSTARPIGSLHALVLMARPSQVALVILVFTAGVLLAAWRGTVASDGRAVATGLALLLAATVAVHWANEAVDVATDARSHRTAFSGGSGALGASGLAQARLSRPACLAAPRARRPASGRPIPPRTRASRGTRSGSPGSAPGPGPTDPVGTRSGHGPV